MPEPPAGDGPAHDPAHPLYAIYGQDPRATASVELGEKLVAEIAARLATRIEQALADEPIADKPGDSPGP